MLVSFSASSNDLHPDPFIILVVIAFISLGVQNLKPHTIDFHLYAASFIHKVVWFFLLGRMHTVWSFGFIDNVS